MCCYSTSLLACGTGISEVQLYNLTNSTLSSKEYRKNNQETLATHFEIIHESADGYCLEQSKS